MAPPNVSVVVVGGGVAGLTAVRALRRELAQTDQVVLVEESDAFRFMPTLLWTLAGRRDPAKTSRPYAGLTKHGVDVVLDLAHRVVLSTAGPIGYDHLVLATGMETRMGDIPGLTDVALDLTDPAGVVRLREVLSFFAGGRIALVGAGIPPTYTPALLEAAMLVDSLLTRGGVRDGSAIDVYVPDAALLGPGGGGVATALVDYLQTDRHITVHVDRQLASVDGNARHLRFADGTFSKYDLLAVLPPTVSSPLIVGSAVAGNDGWLAVDPDTRETSITGVYGIGDVRPGVTPSGSSYANTGVFAVLQAEAVARAVAVQAGRSRKAKSYLPSGAVQIEIGDGRAFSMEADYSVAPEPQVELKGPTRRLHYAKVYFERSVLNLL